MGAEPDVVKVDPVPWIRRYRPSRNLIEVGVGVGVFLPSRDHELYDHTMTWQARRPVAPALVLRGGFYPLSFLGLEAEAALAPNRTESEDVATILGARGQLIAQLPVYSLVPFATVGAGTLGTVGGLGRDVDPSLHFGGGVKIFINRWLGARVDARAHVGPAHTVEADRTFYPEILANLVVALGRPYLDTDGDGVPDPGQRTGQSDACPRRAGVAALRGCPDRDRDGLRDLEDRCPDESGTPARDGCPELRDGDGDTFFDPDQYAIPEGRVDLCPEEVGVPEYQGCEAPDTDGDGFNDLVDGCPEDAETLNGFEDEDGCPDTLPLEVKKIIGTIRGISFPFLSASLTADSQPVLAEIARILSEYSEVQIEIQGHTDGDGDPALNVQLSLRRADSVRAALIDAGVAAVRVRAVGYGGERPVADNTTEEGRAANRRIDFRLLDANGALLEIEEGPEKAPRKE